MISPRSDRAKYRALADDLRRKIESGELAPGALLPSESVLMQEAGVSRNTARDAVGYLRRQGLVVTEMGRGTSVRERPPVRRRSMASYLVDADPRGGETVSASEQRISGADHTLDRDFRVVPATARQAELLEISAGADVLERHFVFRSKGDATQLSVSCYPYELVKGTRVADPINEPWPGGNIAQLRTLGITVTRVTEHITSRRPTGEEADVLNPGPDEAVIAIERRMFAGARPVEYADIVIPADHIQLEYEIIIPDPE